MPKLEKKSKNFKKSVDMWQKIEYYQITSNEKVRKTRTYKAFDVKKSN